jgi:hypothetical protein
MSTDDGHGVPAPATVIHRAHGRQAITELLAMQDAVRPRGRLARIFGLSPLDETSAPWFWSAVGMLEVGSALDGLPPEFRVFHSLPGPSLGDEEPIGIDHLVIGPPGVFTVSVHNHTREHVWASRRDFVVDGHRLPYVRWAEAGVGYVERMLSVASDTRVSAAAIIAVIDPATLTVGKLPRDVQVVRAGSLPSWFGGREPVLDPTTVETIAAAAEHPDTWPASESDASGKTQSERERFDQLRRQVSSARTVRSLWVIAVAATVSGVLVAVGILQLLHSSQ